MSNLLVQNIKHTNGTTAATISTGGNVNMAGHVIQFVSQEDHNGTAVTQNQSTGFVDVTGFDLAITPKFSTSKIFLHLKFNASNITAGLGMDARILRDSTELKHLTNWAHRASEDGNVSGTGNIHTHVIEIVDSPSSTSSITYKVQIAHRSTNNGTFTINDSGNSTSGKSLGGTMLTLMEIGQ
jgi:hypothetical protein